MNRRNLPRLHTQEQPVQMDRRNLPALGTLERLVRFDEEFVDQWTNLFSEEHQELAWYFRKMALRLYLAHQRNKTMHKMDACRLVPLRYAASAKKYVDM